MEQSHHSIDYGRRFDLPLQNHSEFLLKNSSIFPSLFPDSMYNKIRYKMNNRRNPL